MGDKLKAGGLGDASDPLDFPNAFAGSMAKAMEDALNDLLIEEGKPEVPTENTTETRDRRIMFVAIARGIVKHLTDNQAAFTIHQHPVNDTQLANHHIHIDNE